MFLGKYLRGFSLKVLRYIYTIIGKVSKRDLNGLGRPYQRVLLTLSSRRRLGEDDLAEGCQVGLCYELVSVIDVGRYLKIFVETLRSASATIQ